MLLKLLQSVENNIALHLYDCFESKIPVRELTSLENEKIINHEFELLSTYILLIVGRYLLFGARSILYNSNAAKKGDEERNPKKTPFFNLQCFRSHDSEP